VRNLAGGRPFLDQALSGIKILKTIIHQMIKDNTFKLKNFLKEESKLIKKYIDCKTRKCAKLNKELVTKTKQWIKDQNKKCSQKSSKRYYDCSVDFYTKSNYYKIFDKYAKCGKKKCSKEREHIGKLRNNSLI